MVVEEIEQRIYNKHLILSRRLRGKQARGRKDFSDLDEHTHLQLKRLSVFFLKYPNIDIDTFFSAPYALYKDVAYFDLKYFSSARAVKSYTLYMQMKRYSSPSGQIISIKKSLQFICDYCKSNRITLHTYMLDSENMYWLKHVKEGNVNPYTILGYPSTQDIIATLDIETAEFYLGEFGTKYGKFKTLLLQSSDVTTLLSAAFRVIENTLHKMLH